MTEAILIEIAKRFRKLEDAIEAADLHLVSKAERLRESLDALEARHSSGRISYNAWCERSNPLTASLDILKEDRAALAKSADSCRDDMNAMADEIRRSK